ncbi:TRL-like family protein [Crenothrix sp.]|uniref:TRL-like family protein n=1 Tax=Crenothrix sp. TaxID=3100433 RepID=UPI00374DE00E
MKKTFRISALTGMVLGLTACASPYPIGSIMTDINLPVQVTSNEGIPSKVGEATCHSYLSMVSTGDCSIDTAKKNASITKVHHVDWHAHNILGLIGHYKLTVYGD